MSGLATGLGDPLPERAAPDLKKRPESNMFVPNGIPSKNGHMLGLKARGATPPRQAERGLGLLCVRAPLRRPLAIHSTGTGFLPSSGFLLMDWKIGPVFSVVARSIAKMAGPWPCYSTSLAQNCVNGGI